MPAFATLWITFRRLWGWAVLALLLTVVIAIVAPQQLSVTLYKASLVTLAALLGFALDLSIFPYARPDSYLIDDWLSRSRNLHGGNASDNADYPLVPGYETVFAASMLRRALIVGLVVLGFSLGL